MKLNNKTIAVLGTLAAFGFLTASASTLGGVSSAGVGADQTIVAACDNDGIALDYTTTYNANTNSYRTSAVTLSGVAAACQGKTYKVALSDGAAAVSEVTGTVALTAGSQTIALPTPVDSKNVAKAALAITG